MDVNTSILEWQMDKKQDFLDTEQYRFLTTAPEDSFVERLAKVAREFYFAESDADTIKKIDSLVDAYKRIEDDTEKSAFECTIDALLDWHTEILMEVLKFPTKPRNETVSLSNAILAVFLAHANHLLNDFGLVVTQRAKKKLELTRLLRSTRHALSEYFRLYREVWLGDEDEISHVRERLFGLKPGTLEFEKLHVYDRISDDRVSIVGKNETVTLADAVSDLLHNAPPKLVPLEGDSDPEDGGVVTFGDLINFARRPVKMDSHVGDGLYGSRVYKNLPFPALFGAVPQRRAPLGVRDKCMSFRFSGFERKDQIQLAKALTDYFLHEESEHFKFISFSEDNIVAATSFKDIDIFADEAIRLVDRVFIVDHGGILSKTCAMNMKVPEVVTDAIALDDGYPGYYEIPSEGEDVKFIRHPKAAILLLEDVEKARGAQCGDLVCASNEPEDGSAETLRKFNAAFSKFYVQRIMSATRHADARWAQRLIYSALVWSPPVDALSASILAACERVFDPAAISPKYDIITEMYRALSWRIINSVIRKVSFKIVAADIM